MSKKYVITLSVIGTLIGLCVLLLAAKGFDIFKNKNNEREYVVVIGTIEEINNGTILVKDEMYEALYAVESEPYDFEIGELVKVYTKDPIKETYPAGVIPTRVVRLEKNDQIDYESSSNNTTSNNNSTNNDNPTNDSTSSNTNKNTDDNSNNSNKNNSSSTNSKNNNNSSGNTSPSNSGTSGGGTNSNPSTGQTTTNTNANKTEADVIAYVASVDKDLSKPTVGESAKKGFVTVVDFIFYGGEIYGKTFKQLSDSAKLQILKLALNIDSKIDSVFPGYKESISKTTGKIYTGIKSKVVELYLDTTVKICTSQPQTCEQAKSDFQDMKKSFGLTWDFITGLAKGAITKLDGWYKVWSGK